MEGGPKTETARRRRRRRPFYRDRVPFLFVLGGGGYFLARSLRMSPHPRPLHAHDHHPRATATRRKLLPSFRDVRFCDGAILHEMYLFFLAPPPPPPHPPRIPSTGGRGCARVFTVRLVRPSRFFFPSNYLSAPPPLGLSFFYYTFFLSRPPPRCFFFQYERPL